MNHVKYSMEELIGNTPLYHPGRWMRANGLENKNFCVKLEGFNATGSVKDRAALSMLRELEEQGILKEGSTIIEPTSGNTGIALAAIAAAKGYRAILTLPETMSVERRRFLAAFGAELVLTPAAGGMKAAIAKAEELVQQIPGAVIPGQFVNPSNPLAHEQTTGPEIWEQSNGEVDVFLATVGTGGTVTGTGRYLKKMNPNIRVLAVEPSTSAVLSGAAPGKHGIQGIGAGFVPDIYDATIVDVVLQVTTEEAMAESRLFARTEGILVGISSGAALAGVKQFFAANPEKDFHVVSLLPDSGDRYFSTELFA